MSMISSIAKDSAVASALAKTLGSTVDELYGQFKDKDGYFDFQALKQNSRYANRIYDPYKYSLSCGKIENLYIVDNGDGKIGAGDLFMKGDGYYMQKDEMAFRYAVLGEKYETTQNEPWKCESDSRLTSEDVELLSAVLSLRSQSFVDPIFVSGLRMVCGSR